MFFIVRIQNTTIEGSLGYEFSKSKVMSLELEGSTTPNVYNRDLHCEGYVCKTSSDDMVARD
jgi:hypothetical protein